MATASVRETLKRDVDTWSDDLVENVIDFVHFITEDSQAEENYLWQKVEEAHAYDREHPDGIVTVRVEDWDAAPRRPADTME